MYIEGPLAAQVFFLLGFLTCGVLGLLVWNVLTALTARTALKLLAEYLEAREEEKDGAPSPLYGNHPSAQGNGAETGPLHRTAGETG